jgi:hypothetical protein
MHNCTNTLGTVLHQCTVSADTACTTSTQLQPTAVHVLLATQLIYESANTVVVSSMRNPVKTYIQRARQCVASCFRNAFTGVTTAVL